MPHRKIRIIGVERRRIAALLVSSGALLSPCATWAQPAKDTAHTAAKEIQGRVVAVENGELYLDVTGEHGLRPGDQLELWRPVRLKHPVSGNLLADRFRIGTIELKQVRDMLSLGRLVGKATRQPDAGDIVIGKGAELPAPDVPRGTPSVAVLSDDPEAQRVSVLFERLRGASLARRIAEYERYAEANPNSAYSRTLLEEAAALRELVRHRQETLETKSRWTAEFEAPAKALAGEPLSFAVHIRGPAAGAVLHARNAGEVTYVTSPMEPVGQGYFAATLASERVQTPRVEYFIEVVDAGGASTPIAGSAAEPVRTGVVEAPRAEPPARHDTSLVVVTDYADYNRLRNNDRVWQTEGTFGLRFRDVGVRALRTGFGVYRGVGGSIEELDELGLRPRRVGLTYGHLEGEFAWHPMWSLISRAVLGLGESGTSGGAQLHIRFGSDRFTNLTLGGEVLGGVGLRAITELALAPESRFPILLRSEVTNQPAGSSVERGSTVDSADDPPNQRSVGRGDIGVRAVAQVGYRLLPELVLAVRGSYQGRTIHHAGPGVGGAVTYTW